jgi:predicted ester cyclase
MHDRNKQLARAFTAAFVSADADTLATLVATDVVDHTARPGQRPGRQAVLDDAAAFHAGFPDLTATIECQVAEGDYVVQYGTATGTNTGELFGAPATGLPARFGFMDMYRIAGGKIAETWHIEDVTGLMRQLAGS